MRALYDRLKALSGAKHVDLAAQEGLTKQRIYQLFYQSKKSKKRAGKIMLDYITEQMNREALAYARKIDALVQLHRDIQEHIRGHVNGEEDQAHTDR